jgi:hypothetical protein
MVIGIQNFTNGNFSTQTHRKMIRTSESKSQKRLCHVSFAVQACPRTTSAKLYDIIHQDKKVQRPQKLTLLLEQQLEMRRTCGEVSRLIGAPWRLPVAVTSSRWQCAIHRFRAE